METKITEINGLQLYHSFMAGAQRIFENQKLLNKINVFPVADADTGTNLASTMRSIANTAQPHPNLKITADALADAALMGARGNSGIIFAQFLYGFSNEIKEEQTLTVSAFAEYMKNAVRYAYEAIANPIEGTMISVIKDWAEYIYQFKDKFDDFLRLLLDGLKKAMESLKMTTENLPILAKHNVVDAGAKGFVIFLEGMFNYFKNGQIAVNFEDHKIEIAEAIDAIDHEDVNFRYCTEALMTGTNLNRSDFITLMKPFGDSMVIAGSDKKMRIHIHTDEPWALFQKIAPLGTITYKKVDDMVMQNDIASNRKSDIGLVTDSTCDLPMELIEKYQIQVLPLTVHFGQDFFLDRITIQPQQFFEKLRTSDIYPSTAQPAFSEFVNRYNYLSTHYKSIISAHISSGMSGTWQNSSNAAQKIKNESGKKIDVIDSKKISSALGLIVLRTAKAIESGLAHDEIVQSIPKWSDNTRILVSSRSMKYMVKSGRVSYSKGLLGKLLGIKPIVEVKNHGKTEVFGKPISEKSSQKIIMEEMKRFVGNKKIWGYAISHADNPETAQWYAEQMKELTGGQEPVFIQEASPVLVTNVGPGVVALSVMLA
ncbi:MAG: DegV family EDD domain-containing protein [Bacteroidales bacterium]|nr:DegV family EDD domain-containing protein [Bacteroidales bacterium]MDN5350460.1 fatty acid kinase [Bacteroidales bacterium]